MRELSQTPQPRRRCGCTRALPLEVPVGAARLRMNVHVPDRRWRLADVVPLARELADALSAAAVQDARRRGQEVPCRPGCCACCRYAVPLSPPEAFRLAEELRRLPTPIRREMQVNFETARRQLARGAASQELREAAGPDGCPSADAVGHWYRKLDLPCPLLSGGLCRQYAARPIACRMYFVTTPPDLCGAPEAPGRRLPMPVSIVTALCRLTAEMERRPAEAVLLPMAPAWASANAARGRATWPAHEVARRLVQILHAAAHSVGTVAA